MSIPSVLAEYRTLLQVATLGLAAMVCLAALAGPAQAEDARENPAIGASAASQAAASAKAESDDSPKGKESKQPSLKEATKETDKVEGLLTLYRGDTKLLAELKPGDLDQDFILLITIARGIGQRPLLGGYSWGFGDDWVWQFRKVGERIHVVSRNVRFRAKEGTPTARAVDLAYTDSTLFSLPIAARGDGGSYLVDLSPIFLSDLPQVSLVMPGFTFSKSRSTCSGVKGFDKNVEIQVAATYASSGRESIDSVPDTRGVTISLHYSLSRLPKTSYQPRLADDRVGYFLSVVKDFSKERDEDRFVRYINRWDLQKADPSADKSPPKEPIKFWLEKTVPYKYRKPIRDGITEWNKAFEKAGFYDAVIVEQQPDNADWEPGDIRYNTFQWITSEAGFAMGPSRVNPLTGQILDADIIFDSGFLRSWKRTYETFTPQGIELLTGGPVDLEGYHAQQRGLPPHARCGAGGRCACTLAYGTSHQLALAATMAATRTRSKADLEKLIMQGLKEVAMHEVGHTLGLRHNFKASTLYGPDEMHDLAKTRKTGLTGSVMDYNAANIAPPGVEQGDYYSTTIGPYDYWAIEYGYKPLEDEAEGLAKIASRSGEPGLVYLTDEDTRGIDPDPHSMRFDMTNDLIGYARQQAAIVAEAMPGVVENLIADGEDYSRARRAFGVLLTTHGRAMFNASRYVGGVYVSRSHKGDPNAPAPFEPVPAEQQRAAMDLVAEQVFADAPYRIPTKVYAQLAPSRWSHWGADVVDRPDYPIHDVILRWQERVLEKLMSPLTLERLHDSELKTPADQDAFTTAELVDRLTRSVFASLDRIDAQTEYTARKPAVSSLQRNLQRAYLKRLSRLALGRTSAPQDCQTLAFAELGGLAERIDALLDDQESLDPYTRAHLAETQARVGKVLEASMVVQP